MLPSSKDLVSEDYIFCSTNNLSNKKRGNSNSGRIIIDQMFVQQDTVEWINTEHSKFHHIFALTRLA